MLRAVQLRDDLLHRSPTIDTIRKNQNTEFGINEPLANYRRYSFLFQSGPIFE